MALTLTEAAKLSTDMMQRGVIETIVKASPILQVLPFTEVEGNSLKYNRENTAAGAAFYGVGDTWAESTATFTQVTAGLTILGGDADVDNFIQKTRSNLADQKATQIALKAKAVAQAFEQQFISGSATTDPNSFDGLVNLVTGSQVIAAGANGAVPTLAMLDQLIDQVWGRPDLLLMSKRSRRKIKGLLVASTHYVESGTTEFGTQIMQYDGIPIFVSDYIADSEVKGGSGAVCSSIYALSFGEMDGLCGLQNGGITVEDLGSLETKDASRTRIKWYCGLALYNALRCARLEGVKDS